MSAPRELATATLLDDGRVLIAGGFLGGVKSLAGCDLYDPASRSFAPTGRMQVTRFGHAACKLADGRVLITGGGQFPEEGTLASAELYDPSTGRFQSAGRMLAERARHTATLLPDGRVLITGGNSIAAGGQLAGTELYDPATATFAAGPDMAEPRMDHTATALREGRVLITGGFNGVGGPHTVASCEVFDPAQSRFRPAPPLPAAVHEQQATLLSGGAVLVTGGLSVAPGHREVLADAALIAP